MMKKIALSVLIIILFCVIAFALKEAGDNSLLSIIKHNDLLDRLLTKTNILVFRVNYLGLIPAAEARLENKGEELYRGKRVYHLSAQANPLTTYSKFLHAQARADSYIEVDKLHTLKFKQILFPPNSPKEEKEILYDQDKNFMELRGEKRSILPDTQDPLSAIFYIQRQNFEIGKTLDININTNQKNYQLYAKVVGKKEYTFAGKKRGVWELVINIRRRDKDPYHKTTLKLWLMDNPSKTPILIKAMTNIGQITARLTKAE